MNGVLLGGHNVVRYKNLRFWPERGLIHVEDSRNNSYKSMSIREALFRVQALNDMVKASTQETDYYDEITAQQSFIEDILRIVKVAQEQGSPDDPSAVRDLARRRPTSIVVPRAEALNDFSL